MSCRSDFRDHWVMAEVSGCIGGGRTSGLLMISHSQGVEMNNWDCCSTCCPPLRTWQQE